MRQRKIVSKQLASVVL